MRPFDYNRIIVLGLRYCAKRFLSVGCLIPSLSTCFQRQSSAIRSFHEAITTPYFSMAAWSSGSTGCLADSGAALPTYLQLRDLGLRSLRYDFGLSFDEALLKSHKEDASYSLQHQNKEQESSHGIAEG